MAFTNESPKGAPAAKGVVLYEPTSLLPKKCDTALQKVLMKYNMLNIGLF